MREHSTTPAASKQFRSKGCSMVKVAATSCEGAQPRLRESPQDVVVAHGPGHDDWEHLFKEPDSVVLFGAMQNDLPEPHWWGRNVSEHTSR